MLLAVECFGGLRVRAEGRGTGFAQRKAKAIVAYLAVTGTPAPRAVLSTLLWGEVPEARARANLRVALTDVRTHLGPVLAADRDEVWLCPSSPVDVDTTNFEAAIGEGRWGAAVALYRGPFLEGFFVENAPGFEEWTARTRERFHRTALGALQGAADERKAAGDTTGLVAVLSRLVALEPWHEEPCRRLMQALARAGSPEAAVDEYRRLRQILADELGAAPEPETLVLAERIAGHGRAMVRDRRLGEGRLPTVPAPSSPIVGREDDIRLVTKTLISDDRRLVSLTGPGGVGKTRLAQEVAGGVAAEGSTGVAFVDFSGLTAAEEIPAALSASVGVPLIGLREPLVEIAAALDGPSTILVLDNLEHLLPMASVMVAELLAHCSSLRILATSRVRLRLDAEQVVRVRPLIVPSAGALDHELLSSPAVELFVRRAESAGSAIGTEGLGDVAELCRQLDGLPLAIELAAMHMRYFTAREILSTLGTSLEELDDTGVERPGRHRTLLDSVGWSYQMLDQSAQRLLRYLGVFRGGVSLDVLSPQLLPGIPRHRSAVVALLDAGLLDRQEVDGRSRLTMMSATQAFAVRALDQEEAADAAARHCAAHLALAERADRAIRGHDQLTWLRRLDEEADNMAAALRHAAVHDPITFIRLTNALSWFWNLRGRFGEGGRWLLEAVDRSEGIEGVEPELAQALMNAALLYARRGRSPGGEALVDQLIDRADTIVTRLGDERGRAAVDHLRILRRLFLGLIEPGSVGHVVDTLRRGQATFDRHGDSWAAGRLGFTLATLLFFHQDIDGMLAEAEAARTRFETLGDRRSVGSVLNVLGLAKVLLGEVGIGRQMLRDALGDLQDVGDYMETVNSLHVLGYSFVAFGDDVPAGARLLGAGARLCANSGLLYAATLQAEVDRVSILARERVGERAWSQAWSEGWDAGIGVTIPG